MRLIDADKLKELYQEYQGYTHSEVILQNIDDQPTVDIDLHKYAKQWNNNGIAHLKESELNDSSEYCYNATQKLAHYEDSITKYNPIERAYKILVATYNTKDIEKEDALIAIEEAIGYLGEALDD